jgi:hypothetical protein
MRADDHGVIHVGISICSPYDQFSKKKGRIIAEGRLTGFAQKHYLFQARTEGMFTVLQERYPELVNLKAIKHCLSLVDRDYADLMTLNKG